MTTLAATVLIQSSNGPPTAANLESRELAWDYANDILYIEYGGTIYPIGGAIDPVLATEIKTDTDTPTDLTITTGAAKTLVLATPVYDDINLGAAQLSRPAASQPGLDTFVDSTGTDTGIQTYAFAVGEKIHGSFEIVHTYKEGTDLLPHIHFQIIAAPTGTDYVRWRMTYTIAKKDNTLSATSTVEGEIAVDTQYANYFCPLTDITGTGVEVEGQFLFTLERIASTGDAFAGEALIQTVGIHHQIDTLGSRSVSAK